VEGDTAIAMIPKSTIVAMKIIKEDRKMDMNIVIVLHELGLLDKQGEICEEIVSEIGYEDGEKLGGLYCDLIPYGHEVVLLDIEKQLKRDYHLKNNAEFERRLRQICKMLNLELSKDVGVMCASNEMVDCYFRHFLLGYSDTILSRIQMYRTK